MVYKVYSRIPVWLMPSPHLTSQVMAASNIVFQSCVCVCVASCSHSTIFYEFANHFHQPSSTSCRLEVFFEFTVPSYGKKSRFPKRPGGNSQALSTPWSNLPSFSHFLPNASRFNFIYLDHMLSRQISSIHCTLGMVAFEVPVVVHLGWSLKALKKIAALFCLFKCCLASDSTLQPGQFLSIISIGQAQKSAWWADVRLETTFGKKLFDEMIGHIKKCSQIPRHAKYLMLHV